MCQQAAALKKGALLAGAAAPPPPAAGPLQQVVCWEGSCGQRRADLALLWAPLGCWLVPPICHIARAELPVRFRGVWAGAEAGDITWPVLTDDCKAVGRRMECIGELCAHWRADLGRPMRCRKQNLHYPGRFCPSSYLLQCCAWHALQQGCHHPQDSTAARAQHQSMEARYPVAGRWHISIGAVCPLQALQCAERLNWQQV